jgi:hypothetical protein
MPDIVAIVPLPRQQGVQVPNAVCAAQWVDAVVLTANVATSYVLPIDSGGDHGTVLGITSTAGPLWINFNGVAVIPVASILDGTAPAQLTVGLSYFVVVPNTGVTLSLICGSNAIVTIEAWK